MDNSGSSKAQMVSGQPGSGPGPARVRLHSSGSVSQQPPLYLSPGESKVSEAAGPAPWNFSSSVPDMEPLRGPMCAFTRRFHQTRPSAGL